MMTAAGGGNILGCAVTGGYVYRGCRIPALFGQYLFTDYCGTTLYSTTINSATGLLKSPTAWPSAYTGSTAVTPNVPAVASPGGVVSFGEDAYGEMYVVVQTPANIYKLVSTTPSVIPLANPDYDRNGTLAVADIFAYLNGWFAGASDTDFNRDGAVGVQDIFDFLNHWFMGCAG
jgi:hypothetical protein